MGTLGPNNEGDRNTGGRRGIGEPPGVVENNAFDQPAGEIVPETGGQFIDVALRTARRGRVCDYLCLRFWPAFNLADAAISIGTVGFIVRVISALLT